MGPSRQDHYLRDLRATDWRSCQRNGRGLRTGGSGPTPRHPSRTRTAPQGRAPDPGEALPRLPPEPDAGRSFAAGAIGEERLGAILTGLADSEVAVLHDRRLPGSVANIDHVVMTKGQVWVIDAKRYGGCVTLATSGRNGPTQRLVVSGRNQSRLLDGLQRQVDHVRRALDRGGAEQVPVRGALCFVDTELPLLQRPIVARGHLVSWPKNLKKHLLEAGTYDADDRNSVIRLLARSFPPAT